MRLIPAHLPGPSDWDERWEEGVGVPSWDGVWRRDPDEGRALPEFEFEEGHELNRNDPPHRFLIGTLEYAHVRLQDARLPRRHLLLFKHRWHWYLERLSPNHAAYCNDQPLVVGRWHQLRDGDQFSLMRPPTQLTYRVQIDEADNWYLDAGREGSRRERSRDGYEECPSRHPMKLPRPATVYPEAPDELRRLSWQAEQMWKHSEDVGSRAPDWAAFARHVKAQYSWYGLEAKPFGRADAEGEAQPAPSRPYRRLPDWIADVVAGERQVPGVQTPLAFGEALQLSGRAPAGPSRPCGLAAPVESSGRGATRWSGGTRAPQLEVQDPCSGVPRRASPGDAARGHGRGSAGPAKDIGSWLKELDESGILLSYEAPIAEKFGTLRALEERMVSRDGVLSTEFFELVGVKKLGHKRTFEKFFKENPPS